MGLISDRSQIGSLNTSYLYSSLLFSDFRLASTFISHLVIQSIATITRILTYHNIHIDIKGRRCFRDPPQWKLPNGQIQITPRQYV